VFLGQSGFVQQNQVVPEGMVREASKLHTGDQQFEHWPQQQTMYMHPMPMPIAPPRGFPNQQKTDDQVCFISQMHGHEPELVLFYSHLEMTRRSHGERFWKENVLWKKKCFS